ncbi:MAG: hypothetical protein NZ108_00290, partial [Bacteroidia bacterium]|nr:hypothetical protein [Bacteroidia bacterium]
TTIKTTAPVQEAEIQETKLPIAKIAIGIVATLILVLGSWYGYKFAKERKLAKAKESEARIKEELIRFYDVLDHQKEDSVALFLADPVEQWYDQQNITRSLAIEGVKKQWAEVVDEQNKIDLNSFVYEALEGDKHRVTFILNYSVKKKIQKKVKKRVVSEIVQFGPSKIRTEIRLDKDFKIYYVKPE